MAGWLAGWWDSFMAMVYGYTGHGSRVYAGYGYNGGGGIGWAGLG